MITEFMRLVTTRDADQWASDFGLENDDHIECLSKWLWKNKPFAGCSYAEHPISSMSDSEFWKIFKMIDDKETYQVALEAIKSRIKAQQGVQSAFEQICDEYSITDEAMAESLYEEACEYFHSLDARHAMRITC